MNLQGHNCIFIGSRYPRAVARFIEGVIDSDSHVLLHVVVALCFHEWITFCPDILPDENINW